MTQPYLIHKLMMIIMNIFNNLALHTKQRILHLCTSEIAIFISICYICWSIYMLYMLVNHETICDEYKVDDFIC